jgi:UDP-N-acetylmuramoylalanine--D-glutamate ligase
MIPVTSFAGKKVALFGLGASGSASVRALVAGGAMVAAWDDSAASVEEARREGVPVADLKTADWNQFAALVLAPGVPLTHPEPHWSVKKARAAGIEIIGDIELFCRERRRHAPDSSFIAITGTNGKSTTTALIAHLLRFNGRDAQLGGNIGTPILSLEPMRTGRHHVVEVSSFQIDLAPSIDPSTGVLLNITPDHIDRHGTMDHYASIKERLVAGSDLAVVGADDDRSRAVGDRIEQAGRPIVRISGRYPVPRGAYVEGATLYAVADGAARTIASLSGIGSLRGGHNGQNAAAAAAAAQAAGLRDIDIAAGLRTFPGLPHRMEEVGRRDDILFINDSKATNADAAEKALASFPRIYWIAGGRPKEGGITGLDNYFPRIVKAYLIGEAADQFAAILSGKVPYAISGTLTAAVGAAAEDASRDRAGESVVLLSPACASYDQFRNFEERGDEFRALVRELEGIHAKGEAA